ncbi:3-deoxy-7-phosphoheptulonate synthase [Burkholderia metallica]|uniref:3-deoxy-7-phosphoheptulonate synthase n=1 Tax=Burkholderia metallica TaxID=488729 RepID=UPI00157A3C31|nr:3-deoxy-7-phosphoheptulonate synthase [Burkholderia metallica]NTZ83025.1 3-deoxy-7-phosphoheptulonate synthase [Burkholderia metallica]
MLSYVNNHFSSKATRLSSPSELIDAYPATPDMLRFVGQSRTRVAHVLSGNSDKLLVITGPCSVHDVDAAHRYAEYLVDARREFGDELEILMRVYFEKPRTVLGWKGFVNDPHLNETYDIEFGLRNARKLLVDLTVTGVPIATELLDTLGHGYFSELISWGAIGARTAESQVHREMASGMPFPVGFKNRTDGNVKVAVDAIRAAVRPHHFLATGEDGSYVKRSTAGNPDSHLVLRGGETPNYDAASVNVACAMLASHGLSTHVVIDVSHGNSDKNHENQSAVCESLGFRIASGERRIAGIMIESNLVAGNQPLVPGEPLVFGKSITDACIGLQETTWILSNLAQAVRLRRKIAYDVVQIPA